MIDTSFFHFTLQGLGIFLSIVVVGVKVLRLLHKLDRSFDIWQWEHMVMWQDWTQKNPVPPYPHLTVGAFQKERKDRG